MIRADSQPQEFLTFFTNAEQIASSDTTGDKGGGNRGFRPHELLEAALANCMNITLRMSAQKHHIPLESASVTVSLNRATPEGPTFEYSVQLRGPLSEEQKGKLLASLEHCPVRTTLSKRLHFSPTGL